METRKRICALCLEICETFKCIEKNTKNILDLFLPEKDFTIIQGPVMCENCTETLTKCFDFKTKCLYTHDYLISFINNKNGVKLDLNDVFQNKNITATVVPGDQDICGFCTDLVQNCHVVPLYIKDEECKLERMVEQCLPELDLSFVKKPVICADCRSSLESCFRFVTNCLFVEQRIKRYLENLDVNRKGHIELSDLLQSKITDKTNEMDSNVFDIVKIEKQVCEEEQNHEESESFSGVNVIKLEETFCINENSNDGNKNADENLLALDILKVNNEQQWSPKNVLIFEEEGNKLGAIKIEETLCGENENKCKDDIFFEIDDKKCLFNEEIEIKTEDDFNRFEEGIVMTHLSAHKASSEEISNKSGYCAYQTKQEITTHVQNHDPSTMYKCYLCRYQTNRKDNLKRHLLKHKGPSEVTMYKCDSCVYRTKYKQHLKTHIQNHKYPSPMYLCDSCVFQTKCKHYFKKHLLNHEHPPSICKCDSCVFQTEYKQNFKTPLLNHKHPPPMYKCDSCTYQTRYKKYFNRHLPKHQKSCKITMYKCNSCSYQTKYKYDFKKHNHSEVTIYKCDSCIYQTNYKRRFNAHLLTHKDFAEIHKCDVCTYQTVKKNDLISHVLRRHKKPEIPLYKCDICIYQTQYKKLIARHVQKHKYSPTIYTCDICSYQSYRKNTFNAHLLRHKKPPELTMYKCYFCVYDTKSKGDLINHLLTHKKHSD